MEEASGIGYSEVTCLQMISACIRAYGERWGGIVRVSGGPGMADLDRVEELLQQ